uniref:Ubiquitin-like-conjugating enzyme ATG10 n=1 Tax=Brachionus calyciflorus TaxID=104777 RepID=A0A2Z4EUV6_9BILA|nr:ubiquitin-like--conjugating enzyme ATG10 [Brachionus calyciflorus]
MSQSTIPRSVFNQNIIEIYEKSIKLGDTWQLIKVNEDVYYLEKKDQKFINNEILTLIFHIIYSESYNVPVLYLNMFKSNGSIAKYNDIYSFFNLNNLKNEERDSDLILTQQEHPILFKPFYYMHPCKTSQWMSATKIGENDNFNFTLKWLSFVFSALRIPLDIKYAL